MKQALDGLKIGIIITGSFCNFKNIYPVIKRLKDANADLYPIDSFHADSLDTRFQTAQEHKKMIELLTEKPIIASIPDAEPFGPKIAMDVMIILPCTGNTMSKLANAITDTPALMAAKAHLRGNRPLVLALSTNDGLGLNMKHLGLLMNAKNVYFVPYGQDDPIKKPNSISSHFSLVEDTILAALDKVQLQPVLNSPIIKK